MVRRGRFEVDRDRRLCVSSCFGSGQGLLLRSHAMSRTAHDESPVVSDKPSRLGLLLLGGGFAVRCTPSLNAGYGFEVEEWPQRQKNIHINDDGRIADMNLDNGPAKTADGAEDDDEALGAPKSCGSGRKRMFITTAPSHAGSRPPVDRARTFLKRLQLSRPTGPHRPGTTTSLGGAYGTEL